MKTKTVTTQTIRNERTPGGDIPETVMTYLALHPERFMAYESHEVDTLRLMQMSKKKVTRWSVKPDPELGEPGIETDEYKEFRADMEAIAWLLWRARLVLSWTASEVTRKPTIPWEQAVESGWLKDELFKTCKQKRAEFYSEREARRSRLDSLIQTGALPEDINHATAKEKKKARKDLKADKDEEFRTSTNNPANATEPLPPVEERLKELAAQ